MCHDAEHYKASHVSRRIFSSLLLLLCRVAVKVFQILCEYYSSFLPWRNFLSSVQHSILKTGDLQLEFELKLPRFSRSATLEKIEG